MDPISDTLRLQVVPKNVRLKPGTVRAWGEVQAGGGLSIKRKTKVSQWL